MKENPAYEKATPEELLTARTIFLAAKKFGSTKLRKLNNKNLSATEKEDLFKEIYELASLHVTEKSYAELSAAVRSEISHLHALASDFRFRRPPDTVGPSRCEEIEAEIQSENRQAIFDDWSLALLANKSLRDALHPEDDKVIIEDLPRYIQDAQAFEPFAQKKHR